MDSKEILKKYFGFEDFRPGQGEVVQEILKGRDVLAVMPTGSGKSLCYQVPALGLSGMTVVISPLISLMKDQVDALKEGGVAAAYLNSSLSSEEYDRTVTALGRGEVRLLYVAPERLVNEGFREVMRKVDVAQLAVDEAHCISQWGHDFRPEYREIQSFIRSLPRRPVVTAFTATATERCREDILRQLGLQNPFFLVTGFDRPNLYFSVIHTGGRARKELLPTLLNREDSAIVYCATRKAVEEVGEFLKEKGFSTGIYHGGMSPEARDREQEAFLRDDIRIMVATLAFGMGIDKPDVRQVIHYQMPKSMENYYQEAGRGGRDGLRARATLLFSPEDILLQKFILQDSENRQEEYRKLEVMVDYARSTKCLRNQILSYFHEYRKEPCGNCGNCDTVFSKREFSREAKMILSCVLRMKRPYGRNLLVDVLRGSKGARIKSLGFHNLSTYGLLKDRDKGEVMGMVDELLRLGFLVRSREEYPVILPTKKGIDFLKSEEPLFLEYREKLKKSLEKTEKIGEKSFRLTAAGEVLYGVLRDWRKKEADRTHLPPYIIMYNATFLSLLEVLPKSIEDLERVSGFGEAKVRKYGEEILALLREKTLEGEVYVQVEEIKGSQKGESAEEKKTDLLSSTKEETLRLLQEGMTLEEAAKARDLKVRTLGNHVEELIRKGYLDSDNYVSKEHKSEILRAMEEVGMERLTPIKERVSSEVSWEEIKFLRAEIQRDKDLKNL